MTDESREYVGAQRYREIRDAWSDWEMCSWGTWHCTRDLDLEDVCFCGDWAED